MARTLLLGSQSAARAQLLQDMGIQFKIIEQSADESACDWGLTFPKVLESIALHKMEHAIIPDGHEGDIAFVLTADTMCQDNNGVIHGKPTSRENAKQKIRALSHGGIVGTAFCLDKKIYKNSEWVVEQRITKYVGASFEFSMPEDEIDAYFNAVPQFMNIAGAVTIEGHGAQFMRSCNGSYTAILGLPLFELREALHKIGFSS